MSPVRLAALATLATLAACGDQQDKGPERKTAAGEVLGGSISDAMLPLDTVQSQSPRLQDGGDQGSDQTAAAPDKTAKRPDDGPKKAPSSPVAEPSAAASTSASPQAED
jgi:hypothetical protein